MSGGKSKSPAFQFYAAEFLADENVVLMTNQEVGCYIKLMAYCWREGSIPADVSKLARLCGEDGSAMAQLWIAIKSCFELAIDDASRMVHPRLEKERIKQQDFKEERSESGKKGAEARWGKTRKHRKNKPKTDDKATPNVSDSSANGSAIEQPMAKNGSSSSSSSSKALPPNPQGGTKTKRVDETPYEAIAEAYRTNLPNLPQPTDVSEWNKTRKGYVKARWDESEKRQNLDWWNRYFAYVAKSAFLTGKTPEQFEATFDWLVKPTNMQKVIEGNYHKVVNHG